MNDAFASPEMPYLRSPHGPLAGAILTLLAVTVYEGRGATEASRADPRSMAALGQRFFHDQNLSLNKNQSCASCHDGASGFSAPNDEVNATGAVMFGSVRTRFGNRKPPSAAYATHSPVLHYDEADSAWVGGGFWDGRATGRRLKSPAAEQAQEPFINPVEQALPDIACVVYRVTHGEYAALAATVLGDEVAAIRFPANTDTLCSQEGAEVPLSPAHRARVVDVYDLIAHAIAEFEDSPALNQFSSMYDAYLAGQSTLTAEERRGLALYEKKAKCADCHANTGERALFTDFTYDNIGVPVNPRNPVLHADPVFRDLGLGAVVGDSTLRGAHKVPTLRNVDRRRVPGAPKAYMHNGVFKSLEEVVHFYNTRDVLSACDYVATPEVGVNCWPAPDVAENVNTEELGDLKLTPREERALVAYLRTLTDGYTPLSSKR
jgi:cytochrome c peroxidase